MREEYIIEVTIKRREQNFYQEIDGFKGSMNDGLHYMISKYGFNSLKTKLGVIDKKLGVLLYGREAE
jgi:hypothetical protein